MRILVLAPQPFFVDRGTPIAVRALIETLAGSGHRLDVIVYAEGEDISVPGCTLLRVPRIPGTLRMPPGFSLKKVICDAAMLPMAAWRLARHRYDVIHAVEEAAFIAMLLGPLFRVPYIYDIDSSIPEQIKDRYALPRWLHGALVAAERLAVRRSIAAVCCCRALEDLVRAYAPAVPVQTLEDATLVDPDAEPVPVVATEEPVAMYVGNLESYQGVALLIDGFARAVTKGGRGRLVIIGGTEAHVAEHRDRAARLGVGDRVDLLGPRPSDQLGHYLGQATVVVSPRIQGRNTPMKVFSYLASGRPVLATRLPTHTQVLGDDIAMLVEPTPEGMAEGLRRLFDDPELRQRLADAARTRARAEFTRAAFTRKLIGFYDAHVASGLRRPAEASD